MGSSPAGARLLRSKTIADSTAENERDQPPFSEDDWNACLRVLRVLSRDPFLAPDPLVFKGLIKRTYQTAKRRLRAQQRSDSPNREARERHDRELLAATMRARSHHDAAPGEAHQRQAESKTIGQLHRSRECYVCGERYRDVHHFYDRMCGECAEYNWLQRGRRADLAGRIALVTGGRVKIGFATALKLLRDGARVIVTTRFPAQALVRYQQLPDYEQWSDRLIVYGLDFRDLEGVQAFIDRVSDREPHLDILVNNAAQTQSRTADYAAQQRVLEQAAIEQLNGAGQRLIESLVSESSPSKEQQTRTKLADLKSVPGIRLNRFGEPLDERAKNSWISRLDEIELRELLETQVVNSAVPFLFCGQLKPLLKRSPFDKTFIINVSSLEGQFADNKRETHPHTNMAKAALNMLTFTSASDYARDGIYMNAVDPGWVSQESPWPLQQEAEANGFIPPLDEVDAAARVYWPILEAIESGRTEFGQLYKDYRTATW